MWKRNLNNPFCLQDFEQTNHRIGMPVSYFLSKKACRIIKNTQYTTKRSWKYWNVSMTTSSRPLFQQEGLFGSGASIAVSYHFLWDQFHSVDSAQWAVHSSNYYAHKTARRSFDGEIASHKNMLSDVFREKLETFTKFIMGSTKRKKYAADLQFISIPFVKITTWKVCESAIKNDYVNERGWFTRFKWYRKKR